MEFELAASWVTHQNWESVFIIEMDNLDNKPTDEQLRVLETRYMKWGVWNGGSHLVTTNMKHGMNVSFSSQSPETSIELRYLTSVKKQLTF